ncbi:MAG: benzoate/H(+) symporter BenE family transporter [Hyphomonadaceae bacterium]|nr:benzoate/H(+) symporter BenE family transporter [Hyphomonadaceae bacterium]
MAFERPAVAATPSGFWRDLSATHVGNGVVGFLFAATGPMAVVLATGTRGGLSEADLASWVFGSFFLNGILSIAYCLAYRQPLVFFWTIPGTVLIGPALGHLTFPEVIGAYLATGLLMLALALTGWVGRAMAAIPMPIVMGMVAGVFLSFGLDWVRAFESSIQIAAPMTAVYLLVSLSPAVAARIPPLIAALVVGALAIWQQGVFAPGLDAAGILAAPQMRAPQFSWPAMLELVVPLAITVLVVQNGQGIAVLTAAGHAPPVNSIAAACGVGTLASAIVGAAPTCLTGPVNAIISSGSARHTQYAAGIVVGVLAMLFGLLSPLFTRLLLAAPAAFIATLAGLAMLRVLQSAFTIAFQGRFTLGALVTFLVTVAGIPIFNIGAPFWALIAGALVSLMLERRDWAAQAPHA